MKSSILILEKTKIEKELNQWKINLIIDFDSIIFKIHNNYNIYQSTFTFEHLHQYQLFSSNDTIDKIKDFILNKIEEKKIKIIEKEKYLEFIIISNENTFGLLIINKTKKLSEEIIEALIEETKNLKERIMVLERDKEEMRNEVFNKINKLEDNIEKIEKNIKKDKIHINLKLTNIIQKNNETINSMSIFPSGNIISVSNNKSINIYDNSFNTIQTILNAHNENIFDVYVKDENNFVTCSYYDIKTWIKKNNKQNEYLFDLNQIIEKAHNDLISKVIYNLNGNLISCSKDKTIKIWEENNENNYKNIKILNHSDRVYSILFLKDNNILISGGVDGIKFWDLNYEIIISIEKAICLKNNALKRIDEKNIIVGGARIINIISISEKKIIKVIENGFISWGICIIKNKGVFLVGGESKDIQIYRNEDYEYIQQIKDAHNDEINGIIKIKDNSIVSYGEDKTIRVWSF